MIVWIQVGPQVVVWIMIETMFCLRVKTTAPGNDLTAPTKLPITAAVVDASPLIPCSCYFPKTADSSVR